MRKTAIILFAHLPDFEARAKSLSGFSSQKSTRRLSAILTKHFYQIAKETAAETFLIDTYHQKGKTFAERITNAFLAIYAKGYENVICIGNDCPSLDAQQLQNAIQEAEKGNIVLGPTVDGGAYLIGVPKKHFNQYSFANIRWQSSKTYHDILKSYQTSLTSIIETPLLADLDHASDLYLQKHTLTDVLLYEIRCFILDVKEDINSCFIPAKICHSQYFRGPPVALD